MEHLPIKHKTCNYYMCLHPSGKVRCKEMRCFCVGFVKAAYNIVLSNFVEDY